MALNLYQHPDQEAAYNNFGIKNGDLLDETTINLFCKQLKKEIDDTYNLLCVFAGLPVQDYNPSTEYKVGEIVGYKNVNYIALTTTIGNTPTDTKYWMEFTNFSSTQKIIKLSDYLSKTNQTAYDPGALGDGETGTVDYHPATVKFVQETIQNTLNTQYNDLLTRIKALEAKA